MRILLSALTLAASLSAASVDGLAIHYTAAGTGPKTVILVHGWTCDETTWTAQVPALAEQYRVVTIDLPGHGKTGSPADGKLSMDLFARAIDSVRAEVGAERVTVVGHSMGTPVVIQYARLYPAHTAALVFVDGLMNMNPGRGKPDRTPWLGEAGRKNRERMVQGMFTPATTPELRTKIHAMMLAAPESTAAGAMEAMLDPTIWKGDVLSMPILGLYADKSTAGNPGYRKDHFPHMEYHEIPGTGHFLMLERPAEFNRLLLEFLAHLPSNSAAVR
jgi:pimeloyl-ACP methyl ester carboxylesterase